MAVETKCLSDERADKRAVAQAKKNVSHQERALSYFQALVATPGCAKQVAALKSAPCLTHQLSIRHEAANIKSHYSYCSYQGLAFTHLPPLYNLLLPPSFVETTLRTNLSAVFRSEKKEPKTAE